MVVNFNLLILKHTPWKMQSIQIAKTHYYQLLEGLKNSQPLQDAGAQEADLIRVVDTVNR